MLKIILIRPGTTDFDRQGRILGTLDMPLAEEGNDEVDNVIEEVKDAGLDGIYVCPCESAQQTAQRVANELGVKSKTVDRFQNLDFGLWQGMLLDDVKRKQPKVFKQWKEHPETVCPPEGEMIGAARQRVESSLVKLCKRHKNGTIAIVAPEPVASLMGSILRQTEVRDSWKTNGACGSCEVIDVEPAALISA